LKGIDMQLTALIEPVSSQPTLLAPATTKSARRVSDTIDTLAMLAHDARNLITALGLYCDLLEEPGVLAPPFFHYANELRLVTAAGRRLVARLSARGEDRSADSAAGTPATPVEFTPFLFPGEPDASKIAKNSPIPGERDSDREDGIDVTPIGNLAAELLANRNLLAALAGPGIALTVDAEGGACGVSMTAEDLTRVLVNLVKNSAEAMPSGGRIHIGLAQDESTLRPAPCGVPATLALAFEDNGPGISPQVIEKVFDSGFTTRNAPRPSDGWAALHRGLGLAITRSIVEAAGGSIEVSNRPGGGARFLIELPALGDRVF
jgi:signal transduction histidine kinase